MGKLNKEQKEKFKEVVIEENLFEMINALFKMHGADVQVASLKVQPMNTAVNKSDKEDPAATTGKSNYNVFPPLCKHGIEMINHCGGGSCQWVCNH